MKFKKGDIARYIGNNYAFTNANVKVLSEERIGLYIVEYKGKTYFADDDDLQPVIIDADLPPQASKVLNLTLSIPQEIKSFQGEFTDSEGNVWYVSANVQKNLLGIPQDVSKWDV